MPGMLTEDYILRMINQAMAVLLVILGFKKAGQYPQAQEAIDGALEGLLGLRADLARQMDDDHLRLLLVSQGELDLGRLAVAADLFKEEGDVRAALDDLPGSRAARLRALNFSLDVFLGALPGLDLERIPRILELQGLLAGQELPVETRLALLDFTEALLGEKEATLNALSLPRPALEAEAGRLRAGLGGFLE